MKDDTSILSDSAVGLIVVTGTPNIDIIAMYTDAPAWPTDVYRIAPKKRMRPISKSVNSIIIINT